MVSTSSLKKILLYTSILLLLLSVSCNEGDWTGGDRPGAPEDWGQHPPYTDVPQELSPGSDEPGASSASASEPTQAATNQESKKQSGVSSPLKPVRFSNIGTAAYTVSPWSYTPLDPSQPTTLPDASTVASPGGNPSSYLSLPLGTYTWCYHWELGDQNGDGNIDYAHTIDGRSVILDASDSDDLDFAETVSLSAPTVAGDLPGTCLDSPGPSAGVNPRLPSPDGDLLFSDSGSGATGMFGPEFMEFTAAGSQATLTANAPYYVLPAMYSEVTYGDCIIEVDFNGYSGPGVQLAIIFRSDDVDGGLASYNILALIPGSRTLEFAVWQEGWTQSMVTPIVDEAITLAIPIELRLEVIGSEYVVFINGKYAGGFKDSQITSSGIMGFSITSDGAPASYSFSQVKIFDLP